jgi:hypothetical protein
MSSSITRPETVLQKKKIGRRSTEDAKGAENRDETLREVDRGVLLLTRLRESEAKLQLEFCAFGTAKLAYALNY